MYDNKYIDLEVFKMNIKNKLLVLTLVSASIINAADPSGTGRDSKITDAAGILSGMRTPERGSSVPLFVVGTDIFEKGDDSPYSTMVEGAAGGSPVSFVAKKLKKKAKKSVKKPVAVKRVDSKEDSGIRYACPLCTGSSYKNRASFRSHRLKFANKPSNPHDRSLQPVEVSFGGGSPSAKRARR